MNGLVQNVDSPAIPRFIMGQSAGLKFAKDAIKHIILRRIKNEL